MESLPNSELLEQWNSTLDFDERDAIVELMKERNLFPSLEMTRWEAETGAYPLMDDPEFLQKLLAKREFAESYQTSWKPASDPCEQEDRTFEVTPVQRFVTNLMSPRSPYMSALLFHGVGVGKTAAAISISEAWLDAFPRDRVYIVAPRTIQPGFLNTIFKIRPQDIATEEGVPNTADGVTGDLYMRLTGTLLDRNIDSIRRQVNKMIRRRYAMYGYISFANHVMNLFKERIPEEVSDERRKEMEREIIRANFSGKLLIIDEAHNLRDEDEDPDEADNEAADGRFLTPFLRKVLMYSEGLKLVLMTATPMYNKYSEIIHLLNLLLINDKKATLSSADIFRDGVLLPGADKKLGAVAQHYISFMRGENPISFPIRLYPEDVPKMRSRDYPEYDPRGAEVPPQETIFVEKLPIVPIELGGDNLKAMLAYYDELQPGTTGLSGITSERISTPGNLIVPATSRTTGDDLKSYKRRTDVKCLEYLFNKETIDKEVVYKANKEGRARWLGMDEIGNYSPKFAFLLKRLQSSAGVDFVYMRLIGNGIIPLALALEANGYTLYGRRRGLLGDGIQYMPELGRQCALCSLREKQHTAGMDHAFSPAYYGMLTGDTSISPDNEKVIMAEKADTNVNGVNLKIIIGSSVASEGVDLRFIREIHVLDSWFHLNKTEQILGRGIRFQSHCLLPKDKRNVTIYLYAAVLPASYDKESPDLYRYRVAFRKAVQFGRVSRILKQYAIDCNLNHDAIIISGQDSVTQIDSQRKERINRVSINDMPFTAICDWTECAYECIPKITVNPQGTDDSSYSEYAARWRENRLKEQIRKMFEISAMYKSDDLWDAIDAPRVAVVNLFMSIINNKLFQVTYNGINGYIRYCNGYYVFQPNIYSDLAIPLSVRVARIPVRRDTFVPMELEQVADVEETEEAREVDEESLVTLWNKMVTWCTALASNSEEKSIPKTILNRIRQMSKGVPEEQKKYIEHLEIFRWFQIAFHRSRDQDPDKMRNALLEYFWDNWFSIDEQRYLMNAPDAHGAKDMVAPFMYSLGKLRVARFLNPADAKVIYVCEDGAPCNEAIVDAIEKKKDEPMKTFTISDETMGGLYGFLSPKNGIFVFKTNTPPKEGTKEVRDRKPGRGAECENVSQMSGHIKKLEELGKLLERSTIGNFDLVRSILVGTRKVEKPSRACTLTEIILRYVDKKHPFSKKWFLRPLQALYAGHPPFFRLGKAVSKKTVAKKAPAPKVTEESATESKSKKKTIQIKKIKRTKNEEDENGEN